MPTYACKTKNCKGVLTFPEKSEQPNSAANPPHKNSGMFLIVIKDEPAECSKCGTSYYESELESS